MKGTTHQKMCNAVVEAIHAVSRVNGGVARQQQLDDFNATIRSGAVYGGITARGTGTQEQMAEAQHNKTLAMHFDQQFGGGWGGFVLVLASTSALHDSSSWTTST